MPTAKHKTSNPEAEGWVLDRTKLKVQGKGNKLMATIPVESIRALGITEDDQLWSYYKPGERRIMYEVRPGSKRRARRNVDSSGRS